MVERAARARLVLEAPQALGIARERGGQHLDRDVAAEPRVARAVHLAHPARTKRADDLIRAEAGSRDQRHHAIMSKVRWWGWGTSDRTERVSEIFPVRAVVGVRDSRRRGGVAHLLRDYDFSKSLRVYLFLPGFKRSGGFAIDYQPDF